MIDWVMRDRGVSFRHAVELLRSDLPPAAVAEAKPSSQALPAPVEADAEDEELLRQVVGYYHETLKESPEALEYLESDRRRFPCDRCGAATYICSWRAMPTTGGVGHCAATELACLRRGWGKRWWARRRRGRRL
ncbi:MAG: hypothetical protein D6773_11550, partial [Alphaproteobacteria bacterium]